MSVVSIASPYLLIALSISHSSSWTFVGGVGGGGGGGDDGGKCCGGSGDDG
jgi:hypothetical protein